MTRLRVMYPSGRDLAFLGSYQGVMDIRGDRVVHVIPGVDVKVGSQVVPSGCDMLIDPRVVVLDRGSGRTLYEPERIGLGLEMDAWMADHPEWPHIAHG